MEITNTSHGSPYERGCADKVYGRQRDPHKYPEGSYRGERVTELSEQELAEYNYGYDSCREDIFKRF